MTPEELAAALQRIGPAEIESMAWSPLARPSVYIGDPDENVLADDPYPMASLAAAILEEHRKAERKRREWERRTAGRIR